MNPHPCWQARRFYTYWTVYDQIGIKTRLNWKSETAPFNLTLSFQMKTRGYTCALTQRRNCGERRSYWSGRRRKRSAPQYNIQNRIAKRTSHPCDIVRKNAKALYQNRAGRHGKSRAFSVWFEPRPDHLPPTLKRVSTVCICAATKYTVKRTDCPRFNN